MASSYMYGITVEELVREFALAPLDHPEIIPTVLPLAMGVIIIELYFGKHSSEELGWNTSVGNAVIWIATGINLLLMNDLVGIEQQAVYGLIGLGAFIGYMDFFHRWSPTVAFEISSAGIIYTLAYILVVIIETDLPLGTQTYQAAAVFFLGANVLFKLMQIFIPSSNDPYSFN